MEGGYSAHVRSVGGEGGHPLSAHPRELLECVVLKKKQMLAEDHPRRLASEHVLVGAYLAQGQIKQAVKLLDHVVMIRNKMLSEEDARRLASEHELAGAYRADGQMEKAVKFDGAGGYDQGKSTRRQSSSTSCVSQCTRCSICGIRG